MPTGARIPAALYDESAEATPEVTAALDQIAGQFIEDVVAKPATSPSGQASTKDEQWEETVTTSNLLHRSIVGFQRADKAARLSAMEALGVADDGGQ